MLKLKEANVQINDSYRNVNGELMKQRQESSTLKVENDRLLRRCNKLDVRLREANEQAKLLQDKVTQQQSENECVAESRKIVVDGYATTQVRYFRCYIDCYIVYTISYELYEFFVNIISYTVIIEFNS